MTSYEVNVNSPGNALLKIIPKGFFADGFVGIYEQYNPSSTTQ
jgi:hypothetical protein